MNPINLTELRATIESGSAHWGELPHDSLLALLDTVEAAQEYMFLSIAEAEREDEVEHRLLNALARFTFDGTE
jgi:hypothetical protein